MDLKKKKRGIGIVIKKLGIEKEISINELCSIFLEELWAIYKILEIAANEKWDTDLLISTDSQSTCKDLGSFNVSIETHEWVLEIKRKLKNMRR